MEQTYPRFTPDMKKTHKILIPNMAPVQFRILAASMENHGYQVELLGMIWTTPPSSSPRPAAAAGRPTTFSCCGRLWKRRATAISPC